MEIQKIRQLDRKQAFTLISIVVLLLGLLAVPPLLQHFYGINAVKTAFAVIIVYALLNWYMKKK